MFLPIFGFFYVVMYLRNAEELEQKATEKAMSYSLALAGILVVAYWLI